MRKLQGTKMNTTQMIEFLKEYEFGGASGRSREITFKAGRKYYDLVALSSTGDGLVTEIYLELGQSKS